MRRAYQSDFSDAEWSCLESYLPAPKANGRPRIYPLREILDAIFYVVRSGCPWRLLPHDFPPWKTVYHYFRFWRLDGTWERMHAALRDRLPKRLSHLWLDAGYTGEDKGVGWVQEVLGWTAEIVRHPPKMAPEEVMRAWVRKWNEEEVPIDLEKLLPGKGPRPFLPKRWIVERTFAWLGQNRRMSKDYERLPESGEAFIYVAMSRLMARRLARS
jgi:putative transposase